MVDLLIQFRSRGWSGSADTFGPWRSIECQALGAGWARGSPEHRGLLNYPETTQANVQLYDPDRILDPANASGPYYGQIDVGADIRFLFGGRQVFLGRIQTLDHVLEPPTGMEAPVAIASIDAQEYQGKLALTNLWAIAWPDQAFDADESSSARVNRILDMAQVGLGPGERDIHTGGVLMWDYNINPPDFGNAWDHLVMTMRAELGSIEMTTTGVVRTRSRSQVWPSSPPAPTLQLGCHGGAIPVYEAEFATVRDTVRNSVNTSWQDINVDEGGPHLTDAASIAKYGLRSYSEEIGIFPDMAGGTGPATSHEAWKTFFLARMKNPMRQWRVTVRPVTQADIDAIELTPLYTGRARLTIDQHGPMIDLNLRLVGMEWSVDPDGQVCRLILGEEPAVVIPPPEVTKYRTAVMATSGLVGYWRLGDAAATTATDTKGTNHGTYAGSPLPTTGQLGATSDTDSSANWGSIGGWIDVPDAAALDLGDQWSIEAWVKLTAVTSAQSRAILSKGPGAYYLRVGTTGRLELAKGDTALLVSSTTTLPAGAWTHVVGTKSNLGVIALYINGVDRTGTTTNATTVNNAQTLLIGADQEPSGAKREGYVGGLDEVALYNVALSAATVTAHWNARV